MSVRILEIENRTHPRASARPPRLSDFVYREGEYIPSEMVIENPNISLYCLDDESRHAIFVATAPDVDLRQEPFFYVAQRDHAQHLLALPFDELFQLAEMLQAPDHLILIYTVGRSGSTLLSQVFDQVEAIASFSEPDMFTSCLIMRQPDGSRDQEITNLIKSGIRMLCNIQGVTTYAIKWRDWMIHIGDLTHNAFPNTRNLFLYRDAEKWADSWHRVLTRGGADFDAPEEFQWMGNRNEARRLIPLFTKLTEGFGKAKTIDGLTTMWLSTMDGYLKLYRRGIPFLAVRYDDLNARSQEVVRTIFEYCDVPVSQVTPALTAFEQDAQRGTGFEGTSQQKGEKAPSLSAEHAARLRAILQKHDTIKTPDFTVPGTLVLKQG